MNTNERPFIVSKDVLDTINSVTWFFMDASWMLQMREVSLAMIVPTILTGLVLCYMEKRKNITFINIAILCWICMNVSWMFSDIHQVSSYLMIAKIFFCTGLFFIVLAIATSEHISDTFSHFKRFRIKNFR